MLSHVCLSVFNHFSLRMKHVSSNSLSKCQRGTKIILDLFNVLKTSKQKNHYTLVIQEDKNKSESLKECSNCTSSIYFTLYLVPVPTNVNTSKQLSFALQSKKKKRIKLLIFKQVEASQAKEVLKKKIQSSNLKQLNFSGKKRRKRISLLKLMLQQGKPKQETDSFLCSAILNATHLMYCTSELNSVLTYMFEIVALI